MDPQQPNLDVEQLIEDDHRAVEATFAAMQAAGADGAQLRSKLVAQLTRHSSAEESVVYPMVKTTACDGEELDRRSLDEHDRIERLLGEVADASTDASGFLRLVARLEEVVALHVAHEEGTVLPLLRAAVGDDAMLELGEAFRAAKADDTVEWAR